MQELISITTDEQGSSVVSGRELHRFLIVRKDFSSWIKHRIQKYGLIEKQDYEVLTQLGVNPTGGRPQIDYVLTVDAAKELSMVEGNEKGKQARQYFIEAEKALRQQSGKPASTEQLLLTIVNQQAQLLSNNQQMIAQLRADVDQILKGRKPTKVNRPSQQLSLPGMAPPTQRIGPSGTLRQRINRLIARYCDLQGYAPGETYNYLYRRMSDVHRINVHRLIRRGNESILDAIERYGHLERLYALVTSELIPDQQ